MSGAGNVFLVGDAGASTGTTVWMPGFIRDVIAQHPRTDGLPIEGVILLTSTHPTPDLAFTADFYNPDGSHGMMCGNGARCIVRFFGEQGTGNWEQGTGNMAPGTWHVAPGTWHFTLNGVTYSAVMEGDIVTVHFPPPRTIRHYAVGELDNVDRDVWYVDVNSDHVVIDGPLDDERPIVRILSHHPAFVRGVNVNMVERIDRSHARIATFERGVEAITGACGTGALSSAIALYLAGESEPSMTIIPPSGRPLTCTIITDDRPQTTDHRRITELLLTGDALFDSPPFEV